MNKAFLSVCALLCTFFVSLSTFAEEFQWNLEDYQPLYGDFDGDTRLDTFLIAKSPDNLSRLYLDTMGSNTPSDFTFHFDSSNQHLLAGDFDHDGRDEFMVLDSELEGEYYLLNDQKQLVEGDEKLKIKGYNDSRHIDFTHLYRGDFNGDTVDDLLAYAEATHDIVVFHNKNKTNKIKFKFDAQLSLDNPEPLTLKIRDFNGDGMQDIALLSQSAAGGTFVAFAGKKGRFKRADFEDISGYLGGEDFSTGQHSVYLWSDGVSDEQLVVRLPNAQGGVDEEGNPVAGDGSDTEVLDSAPGVTQAKKAAARKSLAEKSASKGTSTNTLTHSHATQQDDTACEYLAYSPVRKVLQNTCLTQSEDDTAANTRREAQLMGNPQPGLSATISPPATVTASVPHGGDDVTISWSAVTGVDHYHREVSINGGGWQNRKTYPHDQTSVVFYNQQSRSYQYRVRACNTATCSGWRVSSTITVNPTPSLPLTPSSAPTVYGGTYHANNVSQIAVGLPSVSGATYYELYVDTTSTSATLESSGSSTVQYFKPDIPYGYLYIKYKACNADGCSGFSPWQRIYIYAAPGTPGSASLNSAAINVGGNAILSWSRPGGMIPDGEYHIREVTPWGATTLITTVRASVQSSYSYTVSPRSNNAGTWQYRVNACNPGVGCGGTRSANLTVVNRNPFATPKSTSVNEGAQVSIHVMHGAGDSDGHSVFLSGHSAATSGSVSCLTSTGYCTYTASNNLSGNITASFTYTIGDGNGGSATATVTINVSNVTEGTTATPTISPAGGSFTDTQTVTMSTTTPNATIYYTLDGSTPTQSSAVYSSALTLSASTTVKAFATAPDHEGSGVNTQVFTKSQPTRRVLFIHTDALGSPAAETDESGNGQ